VLQKIRIQGVGWQQVGGRHIGLACVLLRRVWLVQRSLLFLPSFGSLLRATLDVDGRGAGFSQLGTFWEFLFFVSFFLFYPCLLCIVRCGGAFRREGSGAKETLLSWVGAAWMVIHTYLRGGDGVYHWRAFGFHTERSRKCWVSSGMHKSEKRQKKISGYEQRKRKDEERERAALKTKSIVECVCLGS
jgi:hypothetical protein